MKLAEFNHRYPLNPPRRPPENEDEMRMLTARDGVKFVGKPPIDAEVRNRNIPQKKSDKGCHLWVFTANEIPYLLEHAEAAVSLQSKVIKHTNFTGGEPASCGGELWVSPIDDSVLYLNGCSGRYGPKTSEQLCDAEEVFTQLGYKVISFGWDEEVDKPSMVLR